MSVKTSIFRSTADVAGQVVSAERIVVREISGENTGRADIYLQVFDLAAAPADGVNTMKLTPIRVPAGKRFDLTFFGEDYPRGLIFDNGLYICSSFTKYTKTITGASIDLQVMYDENVVS
jgi:hypothetical protein